MKSVLVLMVLFSFNPIQLISEAGEIEPRNTLELSSDKILHYNPDALEHVLKDLISGSQAFRNEIGKLIHQKESFKLEKYGLKKIMSQHCNYTDIEENVEGLLDSTITLATNVSVSVENICNQLIVCANTGFPKSITCFLSLAKDCATSIAQINEALDTYIPTASKLLIGLEQDMMYCMHW